MLEQSLLLAKVFDDKVVAVLQTVLTHQDDFGVREISRETNVSTATTYRIIQRLKELKIISKVRKGRSTFYAVNKHSDIYNTLYTLVVGPKPDAVSALRSLLDHKLGQGNYDLLIKGKDKERKVIVVSDFITETMHSEITQEVNSASGEKLNFASLSRSQYQQMKSIGIM